MEATKQAVTTLKAYLGILKYVAITLLYPFLPSDEKNGFLEVGHIQSRLKL